MPPLQQLLEQLGPPPPEVCVEWAWQIESVVEGRLDQPLDWSQLVATPDGDLQRRESNSSPTNLHATATRAQDLVDQLLRWSHGVGVAANVTSNVITSPVDRQTQLRARTLQLATQPVANKPNNTQRNTAQVQVHKASAFRHSKRSIKGTSLNATPLLQNQNSRSVSHQWSKPLAIAVAAVAFAVIGCLTFFALRNNSHPAPPLAAAALEPQTPRKQNVTRTKALNPSEQSDSSPQLELLESSIEANDEAQLLAPESKAIDSLNSSGLASMIATPKNELAGSSDPFEPNSDADQPDRSSQIPVGAASDSAENSIEPMPELGDENVAAQVNLLAEMDKIVQAADHGERESELLIEPGTPNAQPAMMLDLFPTKQTRKFAAEGLPRLRSPVWHLRVAVAEGLDASPPSAQSIEGRDAAYWVISDSKARQPATQIHVQAQLHNPRMATLRWSIAAGASDIPQFLVPLDTEMLDAMQSQLTRIIPHMQQSVEQLRGAGRTTGLPSDIRSRIVKQRQELEVQIRTGKRLLEIVADANQLLGWLDGQLHVHAQLFDPATDDSTPLLQFGTLSEAPAESTDGEAKVATPNNDLSAAQECN